MTPFNHAISSAEHFGGDPSDYIEIHDWFDETKQFTGNWTHRALRHHAAGIQWAIQTFGHVITNSDGKKIPVKIIAEQHVIEDCGYIPTVSDWTNPILEFPEEWMLKVKTKTTKPLEVTDG
ncbi:MAG: hypothetical protein EB168_07700 [Euryarchaeota archaeon]|jgi:hypothetical protein|nr:hypothetical protein [Euryarchaeota archaeon]